MSSQNSHDQKAKPPGKVANKKTTGAKPPPKAPKEKPVKPKKEVMKPVKAAKPDPTPKSKVAGHQPGVVRSITYYKASKTNEDDQRGGKGFNGIKNLFSLHDELPSERKQTH